MQVYKGTVSIVLLDIFVTLRLNFQEFQMKYRSTRSLDGTSELFSFEDVLFSPGYFWKSFKQFLN